MRWYDSPECWSSSASVASRNSKSGAPSKFDPTSSRSCLRFLSENGMAATLPRSWTTETMDTRGPLPHLQLTPGSAFSSATARGRRQERRLSRPMTGGLLLDVHVGIPVRDLEPGPVILLER